MAAIDAVEAGWQVGIDRCTAQELYGSPAGAVAHVRAVEVAHNLVTAAGAALFGDDAGQFEGMRQDTAADDGVEVADGRLYGAAAVGGEAL